MGFGIAGGILMDEREIMATLLDSSAREVSGRAYEDVKGLARELGGRFM